MKSKSRRAAVVALASVSLSTIAVGGVAVAQASTGTTIKACANKSNGALRLASKCRTSEKRVTWGAVGPQGPQGPQGVPGQQGSQGLTGATGPSNVYEAYRDSGPSDVSGTGTTVVTLSNLPAGSYVIHAKAEVASTGTGALTRCQLNAGGNNDFSEVDLGNAAGMVQVATLPEQVVHTFTAPGAVTLVCSKDSAQTVGVIRSKVTAILVGSISDVGVTG